MPEHPLGDHYLGDGVYATWDPGGEGVWLRTPRQEGTHEVYLDTNALRTLERQWQRLVNAPRAEVTP